MPHPTHPDDEHPFDGFGFIPPRQRIHPIVRNLYGYVRNAARADRNMATFFCLGVRVGIALCLQRPYQATRLLEELKVTSLNLTPALDLEVMHAFESEAINAIFDCTIDEMNLPTERN